MSSFHGHIVLEQRDPNPSPDRPWQDITTELAKVALRGGSPLEVLMAMADHLAALIKQAPESTDRLRKQAADIMRIGLPPVGVTGAGADQPPPPGG